MNALYAILDIEFTRSGNRDPLELASLYFDAGVRWLQVRAKTLGGAELLRVSRGIVAAARPHGATVIINDRPDIAVLADAGGVHVGQDDLAPEAVRRVMSAGEIGLSTHTREQIAGSLHTPATYIAVGPVFGTATKDTGYAAVGLDLVRYAAQTAGRPIVAIGGITLDNARSVLDAGAAAVAVISDLLRGDPRDRVRAYLAAAGQ